MMPLTYVELFAGAGGLSRGLEMAGWECVAHAEWDAHARAVLRRHWPNTPLFGDVSTLTGQMIAEASGGRPVTMLTGGSPCQDLSIAGKRAGMTEDSGTRSSLYFEQVRLWHELNAISPCPYLLWENVLGAFSSNNGRDFAAVLSALVGTPVAVPEDGWKGGGGVVSGCTGVAAWRVLDCQFFGPPQRRRRVFVLGVRAGGADPAEVLSLLDRLSGHPESGSTARQDTAPDAGASVASGGGDDGSAAFDSINVTSRANRTRVEPGRPSPTLHAGGMSALTPWDSQSKRLYASTGIYPSLQAAERSGQQQTGVLAFAQNASGELRVGGVAGTLGTNSNASGRSTPMISGVIPIDTRNATRTSEPDAQNRQGVGVGDDGALVAENNSFGGWAETSSDGCLRVAKVAEQHIAFHATQDPISGAVAPSDGATAQCGIASVYDARGNGLGSVVSTLPGDHLNRITDYTPVVMRQREGKAGGGKGPLVSDKSLSLTGQSDQILFTQQALGEYADKGVASSIKQRDHKDKIGRVLVVAPTLAAGAHPGSYNGQDGAQVAEAIIAAATDDDALAVNVLNGAASVQSVMGTLGARSGGSEVGAQTRGVVMASLVRPRRLMPIECERLMGWSDCWTERGIDEQGRDYALSDSARYKLCGNGVASPVAAWIGWRLRVTLEGHA